MRELPEKERPREKMLRLGARGLSDAELLAILLRTGTVEESALSIAQGLLKEYEQPGGVALLAAARPEDLSKYKGIGNVKAITITAAIEFGRRLYARQASGDITSIRQPEDAANWYLHRLRYVQQEEFHVLLLSTKHQVLASCCVAVGTMDAALVDPRRVFQEALRHQAAALILAHNHPSGDPSPSKEDIALTLRLAEAGKLLELPVLDHVIIGDGRFVSLKEKGLLY
ncbi:MAG: DNA repair protein RadC [Anaeromusa sp.]|uniref:RadC family protein n=1 Tax=Anaeromusa sp. TaxID=1872520 RepID=UPI002620CA68|nr:DNA repair protein RadC [Anaeromusa sp.]MDD3157563.1 DNA repair protein RadC [Anaeromusa sp.]MEA4834483.1 DNA repair protein RadC [Anaeromusa sp.]